VLRQIPSFWVSGHQPALQCSRKPQNEQSQISNVWILNRTVFCSALSGILGEDQKGKDRAGNNFPFWRPNFTISLAAPQSRNPHRRIATPPAPLNRSRPNLRQTWTSNSPIYFVHGPYSSGLTSFWMSTSRTISSASFESPPLAMYRPTFPFAGPPARRRPTSSPFSQTCVLSPSTLIEIVFQLSRS